MPDHAEGGDVHHAVAEDVEEDRLDPLRLDGGIGGMGERGQPGEDLIERSCATFAMLVSNTSMKVASITVTAISHGFMPGLTGLWISLEFATLSAYARASA